MWSTVGSVGVLNSSDASKVVLIGSIAQLGPGISGVGPPLLPVSAPIEERIGLPTITATLRYPVQQTDFGGDQAPGVWNLTVRYRDGNGSVSVQLIQVAVDTGVETSILNFQSGVDRPRSNNFHNEIAQNTFGVNFENNAYYVAATLTGPATTIEIGIPPAIQLMQIGFAP